ncbi:MAG: hypothetical protein GX185_06640 [Tissierellia bacterium]|nr:hypothetical protein [Tissierellia bacterium]
MEDNHQSRHRTFKLFLLLLLIGVLFFIKKDNQDKLIMAFKSLSIRQKALELKNSLPVVPTMEDIMFIDDNMAYWNGDKLTIIDKKNNPILEKQFNFEEPYAYFGNKSIYVVDTSKGNLYILDHKGETRERVSINKAVFDLKEDYDNIIIHTKAQEEELIFLDKKGLILRNHPLEEGDLLTYSLAEDGTIYSISNLVFEDELTSWVYLYTIEGQLLENIPIVDEIIIYTQFVDHDLVILTDRALYYIKDGKIHWKKPFSKIKDISIKDKIYILHGDYLELIDFNGRTLEKIKVGTQYNRMLLSKSYTYLYGQEQILGLHDNEKILSYRHDTLIKKLIIDGDNIAILDKDGLHIYKLINK